MSTTVDNCIFCKIAQKKIDAKIIDENENAIALLDAFPLTLWLLQKTTMQSYKMLIMIKLTNYLVWPISYYPL